MNAAYLTEKAVRLMEERPEVSLCYESFNSNEAVVERLTAMGYEVESLNYYAKAYPEQPEAPRKDEYDTTEEYEQAQSEFEQDLNDYTEECEEIRTRSEAGEIILISVLRARTSYSVMFRKLPVLPMTQNRSRRFHR